MKRCHLPVLIGSLTGEAAAEIIRKELYGDKPVSELSEAEKENISSLSQLASGLATALGGGDISDIGTSVASSKNAVENNDLGEWSGGDFIGLSPETGQNMDSILHASAVGYLTRDEAEQALKELTIGKNMPTGSTEIVMIYSAPGVIAGAAIEAGVPVTVVEGFMIGAGSNGGYQLIKKPVEEFSLSDVAISGVIGGITAGQGWVGTVSWGAVGGAASSAIKGDNPVSGAVGGATGSVGGKVIGDIVGPVAGGIMSEAISDSIADSIK